MNLRFRSDVDAAGRLVEHEVFWLIGEPFAEHDLLLIAAEELSGHLLERACLDRKSLDAVAGEPALGGTSDEPGEPDLAECGEAEIFAHRHRPHQALRAAVLRHVGDTERARL